MTAALTAQTRYVPAEWAPQKAIWTAWPADATEWNGNLEAPRRDVAAMIHALAPTNMVRLLVSGVEAERSAQQAINDDAEIVPAKYGDIWLRDTGPIFARGPDELVALRFKTNGWGGKFDLAGDDTVGDEMARLACVPIKRFDFVLEGGAIDHDGEGTVLTTRQTLLNANRNGWSKAQAEAALRDSLGVETVLWIDEGLKGDHTDGHIDNIARFVGSARVVCQSPGGADDPNASMLDDIAARLEGAVDAKGRKLVVNRVPSPGRVLTAHGEIAPASHMNFVIANGVVIVPVYGTPTEAAALEALEAVFPGRKVIGLPAFSILGAGIAGGGAFHCITREEPAL